ncbi:MAG: hypothetical protein LBU37_02865, partial [Tannerellaceae bacterium]|nr:hypothetical protein [Tannerellaceae bacterium]
LFIFRTPYGYRFFHGAKIIFFPVSSSFPLFLFSEYLSSYRNSFFMCSFTIPLYSYFHNSTLTHYYFLIKSIKPPPSLQAHAINPITQACLALSFSFQPVYKRLRMNGYG